MDTGERTEKTGEKSKGAEKEKSKGGEKENKVDKERKGGKKVKGKLDARDSAREQSKDNFTGDEVRDRCFSSKKLKKISHGKLFRTRCFSSKS